MQETAVAFGPPPTLRGYTIDSHRAWEFRDRGMLLTMRLETSRICNLNCVYCNNDTGAHAQGEISFSAMQTVIRQVRALGAESVVVIGGGEPLLYPRIKDLISDIATLGMIPVIITNGLQLTQELCSFLFEHDASLLLKCDSLNSERQDRLAGKIATHAGIARAIDLLMRTGFNRGSSRNLRSGLSFVVTKINFDDILPLWQFCRENNLFPNFEEFIPRGRGLENREILSVDERRVFELKRTLLEFDRKRYGYDWLVHAPLPGHGCLQPICSVYVTSSGIVQPCPDIAVSRMNIRDTSIRDIIQSPFFQLSRNIEKHLQGKCCSCKHGSMCIGCRGNAFSVGVARGMTPEQALCSADPLCLR